MEDGIVPDISSRKIWAGRYSVRAVINYRGRHGKAGTMQVITYQPSMSTEEITSLLEGLGIHQGVEGWERLGSQVKDTFSLEQAEVLTAYLDSRAGTKTQMREASIPVPSMIGASALPTLPSFKDGLVYRLYTEKGYNLPFKVEAVNLKTYLYMTRLYREIKTL